MSLAGGMRKVTLQQELLAAAVLKQAKWEALGGWKDPAEIFKPETHPLKEVLQDIRHRRAPYLERKDPTLKLLRQSIIRSKTSRHIKKAKLQVLPAHARSLKVALADIRNHRAAYVEENDPANEVQQANKSVGSDDRLVNHVKLSGVQHKTGRVLFLDSIQHTTEETQNRNKAYQSEMSRPAYLQNIAKQSPKLSHDDAVLAPELQTVLFDQDDFSTLISEAHTDPVLHYLSSLERTVVVLSQEMKLIRSQMLDIMEYSKTGHMQDTTSTATPDSDAHPVKMVVGQAEEAEEMIVISAVMMEEHDDWVDVM